MTIRLATRRDIEAISDLYTEFFAYHAAQQPQNYAAVREEGKYPAAVIDSAGGDIIVEEAEDGIVGFVHLEEEKTPPYASLVPRTYACIVDLIVHHEWRGQGIGRLLLAQAKAWARSRDLQYLELMVLENNEAGKRFYERERFVTMSRTMRLDI